MIKLDTKMYIFKEKKLKTIIIILALLMLSLSYEEQKKEYLDQSYRLVSIANSLRSKYWGIEYFFEFNWFSTKRDEQQYKSLDLNSLEFQEYLQSQYTMFRLRKSGIFIEVSNSCFDVLKYQIKQTENLKKISDHAAMAIIKTLNNNIIGDNKIDANSTIIEFQQTYGTNSLTPLNIFNILKEKKILNYDENIFEYPNKGVFNYFYFFSKDLVPIIVNSKDFIERKVSNIDMDSLLSNLTKIKFDIEKFRTYEEYSILEKLINDWSDPEQYHEFKDKDMQEFFIKALKKKMMHNDRVFQSFFVNSTGLGTYYLDPNDMYDNILYYIEKNEKTIAAEVSKVKLQQKKLFK